MSSSLSISKKKHQKQVVRQQRRSQIRQQRQEIQHANQQAKLNYLGSTSHKLTPFDSLPNELNITIFDFLDQTSITRLFLTCHSLKTYITKIEHIYNLLKLTTYRVHFLNICKQILVCIHKIKYNGKYREMEVAYYFTVSRIGFC